MAMSYGTRLQMNISILKVESVVPLHSWSVWVRENSLIGLGAVIPHGIEVSANNLTIRGD